jgi:hypothetical protein
MKTNDLKTNDEAWVSLMISILLLIGVGVALYLGITAFVDAGGFSGFFEDLGVGTANAATGFVSGTITGLFNFGKKIGEATNPFD